MDLGAKCLGQPKAWAGVAQLVEHRPSKPIVAGSIPVARSRSFLAGLISRALCAPGPDRMVDVAQLVELRTVDPAVVGSNPIIHPIFSSPRRGVVALSKSPQRRTIHPRPWLNG